TDSHFTGKCRSLETYDHHPYKPSAKGRGIKSSIENGFYCRTKIFDIDSYHRKGGEDIDSRHYRYHPAGHLPNAFDPANDHGSHQKCKNDPEIKAVAFDEVELPRKDLIRLVRLEHVSRPKGSSYTQHREQGGQ